MSNIVIYLKLETYLKQWLIHSFGSPVRFPAKSNENAIIVALFNASRLTRYPKQLQLNSFRLRFRNHVQKIQKCIIIWGHWEKLH